jgi:DNA repair protein RecO (recombination protein O)
MQIEVTGMVLIAAEVGDYDRRLVILTKERGKLSAFARGARKPGTALTASCQPFTYGRITLHMGRESNHVQNFEVQNYFEELKQDFDGITYGSYFCELADYLTHENLDDREQLKLLYVTLRALTKRLIPYPLIRRIYEIRALAIDGEEMQVFGCVRCGSQKEQYVFRERQGGLVCTECCENRTSGNDVLDTSTVYALQYILSTPLERLYSFQVSEAVQKELEGISHAFMLEYVDKTFKSLEILDSLT